MKIFLAFTFVACFYAVTGMQSEKIWREYEAAANKYPADHWKKISDATYLWVITDGDQTDNFLLDYSQYPIRVQTGPVHQLVGITITMSDDTFVLLREGKLDGMKAWMSGKMKIKGNIFLAMTLDQLFKV